MAMLSKKVRRARTVRKAPQGRHSQEGVLQAAAALLIERGPAGFNIETIVERTGIAQTTIYRHWPTRNDLLAAAIRYIGGADRIPDTGTIRGDLLAFFSGGVESSSDSWSQCFEGLSRVPEAAKRDTELLAVSYELINVSPHSIRHVLARARLRGEACADRDLDAMMQVLFGAISMHRVILEENTTEAYLSATINSVLDGIRPIQASTLHGAR